MKDTIRAKTGYRLVTASQLKERYGEGIRILKDGDEPIMVCYIRSYADYVDEKRQNECFCEYEVFTTQKGNQYIYWRDEEIDRDFITKIKSN